MSIEMEEGAEEQEEAEPEEQAAEVRGRRACGEGGRARVGEEETELGGPEPGRQRPFVSAQEVER